MAIASQVLSLLNEQDVAALRQLIEREKRRPQNQPSQPDAPGEDNERSVVFAYVPAGGIPARTSSSDSSTGTGTPVATGTGTAILNTGEYTLYGVECQMYREEWDDLVTAQAGSGTSSADAISATARRVLKAVEGWTELVFNPEATALSGPRLVPTTISPWGSRIPIGQGSAGHVVISFRVLSIGYFIDPGTADHFCRQAQVEVLSVSCNGTGVEPGDEVTVWDPNGCYFDIPIELLYNMRGTAVQMAWDTATGIPPCFSEASQEQLDGSPYADLCWWLVQGLCCVEDWFDA